MTAPSQATFSKRNNINAIKHRNIGCCAVEPINFLFPLEDQTVKQIPGTAYFQTEISKPDLKATWYKGDVLIGAGDKYEMTSQYGVHKLTIHDVTGDDECDYSAEFRDVKTSAKLHVCGKWTLITSATKRTRNSAVNGIMTHAR